MFPASVCSPHFLSAGTGTPAEREVFGAFCWNRNEVWLHSDESVSPHSILSPHFHSPAWKEERYEKGKPPSNILASSILTALAAFPFPPIVS
ncbi:hypothetical protein BJV77DRAFT_1054310 [Russula vinacea]|nr:hypothetical protein BJV77DRAFT_1054310 [Russula vinacea]